ncbi:unnamed protein product [Paramecium pentaurelia]|uniref:Uncharacterized protein n=1 Tax=Paramecium pentaurelia TaxID=43138 RepID=A0A8S1WAL9_9CILI|nr:unnamed protein product [Paramecium pentaurelia]
MNEEREFQKKVQVAVDSYLGKRDKQSQMVEQIQNVLEREQLIDQVQKLIVELITKLTERFISNMKKQVENEILKLRETIRSTHQRTYSAVDKEKVEDQVQRTLNKHDVQINMLLEHQAQLKQMRLEVPSNEMKERVGKQYQKGLRSIKIRIGGTTKILLKKFQLNNKPLCKYQMIQLQRQRKLKYHKHNNKQPLVQIRRKGENQLLKINKFSIKLFQLWVLHYPKNKEKLWYLVVQDQQHQQEKSKPTEEQVHTKAESPREYAKQISQNSYQPKVSTNQGYDQLFQQVVKSIQVERQGQLIQISTITQILEKSLDLAKDEYSQITIENRKKRRAIRKSENAQYQQMVLDYNEQVENLLEKKQMEICDFLQIKETEFQDSVMSLMERGFYQQFFMIQASIRQKIKDSLPSTKEITFDMLKKIINFQIQVLKQQPQELKQIIQNLSVNQETQQLIPLAINTILGDLVYEKFQIEEEDMMKILQNQAYFADVQMQQAMAQLEEAMYMLMASMGGDQM